MAEQVRIRHTSSGLELQFQRGRVEFHSDSQVGHFPSPNLSDVVCCIIECHPQIADANSLVNILKVAVNDRASPALHRKMNDIKGAIGELLGGRASHPFKNVRNQGYALGPEWKKVDQTKVVAAVVDQDFLTIKKMIERCKEYVKQVRINTNAAGVMYVSADTDFIWRNFQELNTSGWAILNSVADPRNVKDVNEMKRTLIEIMTYITFWRIGDGLTEAKWREDYFNEVDRMLKKLEMEIRLARNVAVG